MIKAGQRLPSSRLAAREWMQSRGTIAEAYDHLVAEGYATARHGSGTYVLPGTPVEQFEPGPRQIVGQVERSG